MEDVDTAKRSRSEKSPLAHERASFPSSSCAPRRVLGVRPRSPGQGGASVRGQVSPEHRVSRESRSHFLEHT